MKLKDAYEQVMRERDVALEIKAIRDEQIRLARERIFEEATQKVIKELKSERPTKH